MCKNYNELSFTHFVVDRVDGTIFGSAKEQGSTYNFLIRAETVWRQVGEQWAALDLNIAQIIRSRAQYFYGKVPVYRASGLLDA